MAKTCDRPGCDKPPTKRTVARRRAKARLPKAYSQASKVQIGGDEWRSLVAHRLRDGYGVEDIAIWLRCHPSHIRKQVTAWRESGVLASWWDA